MCSCIAIVNRPKKIHGGERRIVSKSHKAEGRAVRQIERWEEEQIDSEVESNNLMKKFDKLSKAFFLLGPLCAVNCWKGWTAIQMTFPLH